MTTTETLDFWLKEIVHLTELLESSTEKLHMIYERERNELIISFITEQNMKSAFDDARMNIEFIKSRIYGYFRERTND